MTTVVVALDGMAAEWLPAFAELSPSLAELISGAQITTLNCSALREPAAIWHEILQQTPWAKSGVYGFAIPQSSLNDLEPVRNAGAYRTMNVPGTASRDNIQPFATWVNASTSIEHSLQAIVRATEAVKNELLSTIDRKQDDFLIARFDCIDLLSHLLGCDFLLAKRSPHRVLIERILKEINSTFEQLKQKQTPFEIISSYGMQRCNLMINLNRILEAGGFCREVEPASASSVNRRLQSLQMLQGAEFELSRPDSLMHVYDLKKTTAASPVAGAIYINDRNRFQSGTIGYDERSTIQQRIIAYLKQRFEEFGVSIQIQTVSTSRQTEKTPDIICLADSVSFDLYGREEIDDLHTPRAVHSDQGFWLHNNRRSEVPLYELLSRISARLA